MAAAGRALSRRSQATTLASETSQTPSKRAPSVAPMRSHVGRRRKSMRSVLPARSGFCHEREISSLRAMDTTPGFPTLRIVSHPLVQHKLSILRDRETPTKIFKELVDEIAMLMAYEATSDLALEDAIVETPLERTVARRISGKKLTLVPILRAGLGMVEGIYRLVPGARVGYVGLYRDHDTLEPVDYYFKVPSDAPERDFSLLEPMLATGRSAAPAVTATQR